MAVESRQIELERVRQDARDCRRCPLWEIGTQTVFGEGPASATLMFVGEAPGAQEDRSGQPFVGPAGQLFEEGLAQAGIDRALVYVTNTVKHRPSVEGRGGRRKNRAPKQGEINACHLWLEHELALVHPRLVCTMGAVAGKALLGKEFRLTRQRGVWLPSAASEIEVFPTVHPSYILIQPEPGASQWRETFFADLKAVAERWQSLT